MNTESVWMADSRPLLAEIESLAKQRDALLEAVTQARGIVSKAYGPDCGYHPIKAIEDLRAILEAPALVGGGAK